VREVEDQPMRVDGERGLRWAEGWWNARERTPEGAHD
jgi:hypothetical protein